MKKIFKSGLSIFLAITIIFSSAYVGLSEIDLSGLFEVKANAASSGTCGTNLTWTLDDEGTLSISGTGSMKNYSSSSYVPWYSVRSSIISVIIDSGVTSIGTYAFYGCTSLSSIITPDSITSIGNSAFYECTSLSSIIIPDSVTSIGYRAFSGCDSLTSTEIPDSVISIGEEAFCACRGLASVTIGNGITSISDFTFAHCTSLTTVTLPEDVTSIGENAFYYCYNLSSLIIPDSVTSIGENAFYKCSISSSCSSYAAQYAQENSISVKLIHNPSGVWKTNTPATCTDDGIKQQECLGCSEMFFDTIPALKPTEGHSWGNWQTTAEPTCSTFGEQTRKCNDCDYIETEQIAKTPHILESEWVIEKEATCETDGLTVLYCSVCKEQTDSSVIPATGHEYGEQYNVSASTCSVQGSYSHKCITCDKEETVKLPLIDHAFGEFEIIATPTCSQQGSKKHICSCCGYTEYVSIETIPHKYVIESENDAVCSVCKTTKTFDFVITTDETITLTYTAYKKFNFISSDTSIAKITSTSNSTISSGSSYKQTTNATYTPIKPGEIVVKVVDTNGNVLTTSSLLVVEGEHQFVFCETCKEATCQETGTALYKCKFCEEEKLMDIPKLNHEFGDWVISLSPTCTTKGEKWHTCISCGEIEYSEILANGHMDVIDAAVEATCTEAGKTEGSHCFVCNEVITAQIPVAAKGHIPSSWITDKKATVYKSGTKHKECTECGEILETATIAQLKCSKPKLSKVSNVTKGVKVSWSKVNGADKYRVYRKTSKGDWKYLGSTSKTSYTDETAKSGTKYYYAVRARNEAGNSSRSSSLSIKRLSVPKISKIANHKDGVKITWGKVKGATEYVVYRKTKDGKWKENGYTTENYYIDSSAKNGKTYYYTVRAYSGSTKSYYNTKGSKIAYLAAPMLESSGWSSISSEVDLSWTKVKGASGYYVYRATGNGKYKKIATIKGYKNTTYIDKSYKNARIYKYKIKAYNSKTTSGYSNYHTIDYSF